MSTMPACPQCTLENTYQDGENWVCADCGFEWPQAAAAADEEETRIVRDANGNVIGTGVVGANGTFLIDLNPAAQPGEHLSLVQTDPSGNESVALEYDVPLTTAPTSPSNLAIDADGTTLTGTAPAGSRVEVHDANGTLIGSAIASAFFAFLASARVFAAETTEGDAAAALKDGKLLVGKTIADDRGWHVGQKVKATAENIVVDKEATAKAQADYQAKVQAHVQELQSQAQQLAASGDLAGAQAKASEIEQYTNDAKNVDPKTLVKTKKVTTGKTLTIGAIVSNSVYRDFAIVNDDLAEQIGNKQTMFVMQAFVTDKRGADTAQVKKALKKTIKKYYTIVVFDRDEYKSTMSSMIDQMLMVLYALLALSIIIAIFGIVNTLALSVSERTKEIGLLRAIGTSRGQVRGMLGIEAAIISVFGTVLGLVVGVAAGVVIRAVYASEGLETLAIPWLQLLVFLLLSIVVGLVSSISPASRALKQPVLDAVASE